jgi:phosphatidylglycerol---prolipoprotein diacylglyceryl transferase
MQIDPVAFRLLGMPVYWYGIMISLGLGLGFMVAMHRTKQYGLDEDRLVNFLLLAVPMAIVGARFIFVVTNLGLYGGNLGAMFNIRGGGLSIHGAMLGGVIAALIYTGKTKISFWKIADVCAPGLILGQAIGRWGNFFNQEAYGVESNLPWAMYIDGAMRHPTFLYEFIWNLLVFAFLMIVSKKEKVEGAIFARYLIWYSAGRFFIEGVRADAIFWGPFRAGQLVSVILIHGGLLLLWWMKARARKVHGGKQ